MKEVAASTSYLLYFLLLLVLLLVYLGRVFATLSLSLARSLPPLQLAITRSIENDFAGCCSQSSDVSRRAT